MNGRKKRGKTEASREQIGRNKNDCKIRFQMGNPIRANFTLNLLIFCLKYIAKERGNGREGGRVQTRN